MGKVTGFMEVERLEENYDPVQKRVKDYREFVIRLDNNAAKAQASRCMDCGTPFCNHGCPVNNIIPDFNELVYQEDWASASEVLHSTNNFPEFTGRVCPAPCEAACVVNINRDPVGIKSIERAIIDRAWAEDWIKPFPPLRSTGKKVAIVGSGPAGMAAAQQLARVGHAVTVFEKNDRIGGLLRYGIPDFKLDKSLINQRMQQMQAEGVVWRTGVWVGAAGAKGQPAGTEAKEHISADQLLQEFDAVLLAGGSEQARDLPVDGRAVAGVHFAMEFLRQQNKVVAGDRVENQLHAGDKRVIVIGGGDTGSDCVGTSIRQGAKSVTQFEIMPMPPEHEDKTQWPYWPLKLRTSSSHEEGQELGLIQREFSILTKKFIKKNGRLVGLQTVEVAFDKGQVREMPGTEHEWPADLVLLAMGFTSPIASVLEAFGVTQDARGNAKAGTDEKTGYRTETDKVFAAGDMRRGQSLVVWAIREGRQSARAIDQYLMGQSILPR